MMANRGLTKVIEECGELIVECAKATAYPNGIHPDGKGPLKERLEAEIADVRAACLFVEQRLHLNNQYMADRTISKLELYMRWDEEL